MGSHYWNLLQQYIIPALRQRQCLETTVFMQDGAPSSIAQQVTALFQVHLGDKRVIFKGFSDCMASLFFRLKSL